MTFQVTVCSKPVCPLIRNCTEDLSSNVYKSMSISRIIATLDISFFRNLCTFCMFCCCFYCFFVPKKVRMAYFFYIILLF